MIKESLQAKGQVTFKLFDENGNQYYEHTEKNLVVLVGRVYIASRMKETGRPVEMSHMEIGQGTTAPTANDTVIELPFTPAARNALGVAGGNVVSNAVTYTATFPAGVGTGTVTEAAIFNASTAGTMLCRTVFPAIGKVATDTLSISWTISILA